MKSFFLFVFSCCLYASSSAQSPARKRTVRTTPRNDSTKIIFDERTFNRFKKNGERSFTINDSISVRQVELNNGYSENISFTGTPVVHRKTFYKKTGRIKAQCVYFYGNPVGIGRQYDEQGNITVEKNWDTAFHFTIADLHKKMLGLNIDIMSPGAGFARSERPTPHYQVFVPVNGSAYITKVFVIDGITGETKEETIVTARE